MLKDILDKNDEILEELAADGSKSGVQDDKQIEAYPFDVEQISISNKKISLSNVVRRLQRDLIYAAPLQRDDNLWDLDRKSRLIESLMLKIPLPLFYVAATKDDVLFIVDGLQRISAIREFVVNNSFKLQSLEFLKFNGKTFNELPEQMRIRIEETELDFAIIDPDSPSDVQRNIFKRLNTGGLPLTEQEIRHALYYGPATDILKELTKAVEFQNAVDHRVNDSRMAAQELVLRFLAFSILGIDEYKDKKMDSFLSCTMQIINRLKSKKPINYYTEFTPKKNITENDIDVLQRKFIIAMDRAHRLFNKSAFRISTPLREARSPVNKSLFEVWSTLLSDMSDSDFNTLLDKKTLLYETLEKEFTNNNSDLKKFIGKDSSKLSAVKGCRNIIGKLVDDIIKEG
jgi:hypothetical protein